MHILYYATSAIALYTAIQSIWLGRLERQRYVYQAYAFLCVCVTLFLVCTALFFSTPSLERAAIYAKIQNVGAFGYLSALVWLMTRYAAIEIKRPVSGFLISYSTICGLIALYSLTLPYGFFIESLTLKADSTPAFDYRKHSVIFQLLALVGIAWSSYCAERLRREGAVLTAVLFATFFGVQAFSYVTQILYYYFALPVFVLPGGATFILLFIVTAVVFGRDHEEVVDELTQKSARLTTEVAQRTAAARKAMRQAFSDELTNLANIRRLKATLEWCRKDQRRARKLLLLQIDRFRELKQTFGESNSDNLILQIADRLKRGQDKDLLAARVSEAQFAIITAHAKDYIAFSESDITAELKPQASLRHPYRVGQQVIDISYSAGMIDITVDSSVQHLLFHAELALEEAANQGGDTIVYHNPTFASDVEERLALERELDDALKQGQFCLHFQPQLNSMHRLVGAEALLRWQHPSRGMISPAVFIPLAERRGSMVALGDWVMNEACRILQQWQTNGHFRGRLSINVSPWQLQAYRFAEKTLTTLQRFDISPDVITLELTESGLIEDDRSLYRELNQLRKAGIKIAIDDFGTGFSSLSYLGRLPIDILKVDKSFVDRVNTAKGRQLLDGMLNIGAALDMEVVTEGVETPEQLQALIGMGCSYFQGFLFCKPLPADEFLRWRPDTTDNHSV